jgi:uncharacterized protein YecT (DUF1311 family)
MQTIKLIFLGLALALPMTALAAPPVPDERTLYDECSEFSMAGMRDCLAGKAKKSQKALKQAEKKVLAAFSQWDEDEKYVKLAKANLAASGKEFVKYRYIHCELISSLSGGGAGNSHEMGRLACVAELNYRRAKQLRDIATAFDNHAKWLREAESDPKWRIPVEPDEEKPSDAPAPETNEK